MRDTAFYQKLADRIWNAEKTTMPIEPFTTEYPHLTIEDAREIQMVNIRRRVEAGARIVGKKVGATNKVMQEKFNLQEPVMGYLLSDIVRDQTEPIPRASQILPFIECEMLFVLDEQLAGPNVHAGYVRQIINLTQTTSASYLLMSSLDISRRNLALRGDTIFREVRRIAEYARAEINSIGGYYAFGPEMINGDSIYDFDPIKLSVHTLDIGMAGIEVYDLLRDDYDIQIEFGDIGNILAYLSIGDRFQEIERLVSALAEIRRRYQRDKTGMLSQEYIAPQVVASPQEAFYADKESLPIEQTEGRVCSEFVMCYPPGIPILAPGERITKDILDYILYAKEKGCSMTGPEDPNIERLNVLV